MALGLTQPPTEMGKSKGVPRHALGVPGRLRPRIISTFGTTRVVGCQPHAPAAFTPGEIPGTHFQRLSRPQGTWFRRGEPWKKSPVTPRGIDPGSSQLVAQCLNRVVCRSFRPAYDTATDTEWQLPEVILTQFVSPDDEHDVLETCSELKIKINT